MIKLMVKYSYQQWMGRGYKYPKRATIMTFFNKYEIDDDEIIKRLNDLKKNQYDSCFSILNINQIKTY